MADCRPPGPQHQHPSASGHRNEVAVVEHVEHLGSGDRVGVGRRIRQRKVHEGENPKADRCQHTAAKCGVGELPGAARATQFVSQDAHEEQQEGDRERQDEREGRVFVVMLPVEGLHLLDSVMVPRRRSADREDDHGDCHEYDSREGSEALPCALSLHETASSTRCAGFLPKQRRDLVGEVGASHRCGRDNGRSRPGARVGRDEPGRAPRS